MTEYDKVIFLDLDVIVHHPTRLDTLFEEPMMFGAMENSKGTNASSMWLQHGQDMGGSCGLINAGVILVTPNTDLFQILLNDVTNPSSYHKPGMTPEQFYIVRVMGHHFSHISQLYNFEVQFHGGVPITNTWKLTVDTATVVLFHFSGGSPLKMLYEKKSDPVWGCQVEKFFVRKSWNELFDDHQRDLFNKRAQYAFKLWQIHFQTALASVKDKIPATLLQFAPAPRRSAPILNS